MITRGTGHPAVDNSPRPRGSYAGAHNREKNNLKTREKEGKNHERRI